MHPPLIDMLARARGGGFSLEVVPCGALTDALLEPLHALSSAFMAEPFEHFAHHARTNDELHIFRRLSGDLAGFQFWRTLPGRSPGERFVLGGKLRILPEARRHGLHLASGLSVLLDQRERFAASKITRLGIASVFGFVSIVRRVAHYDFVSTHARADLVGAIDEVSRASHYAFDAETGLVNVGIFMTEEQLARYPTAFFHSPTAQAYVARNPAFRTNGCYLAFAFDVDPDNLAALAHGAAAALLGPGERAVNAASELTLRA